MNLVIEAENFARHAHRDQVRKYSGDPYIIHPTRVAERVALLDETNEGMICAAWLHDVVEDCGVTYEELYFKFGSYVKNIVWELTNPSKTLSHLSRAERKSIDREHITNASREARIIKLIDRIDNINDMPKEGFWFKYRDESRLLLEALSGTYPSLEQELYNLIY